MSSFVIVLVIDNGVLLRIRTKCDKNNIKVGDGK